MQPNLNVMTFVKQTHNADLFCLPVVRACTCSCTGHLDVLTVPNTAENNDIFGVKCTRSITILAATALLLKIDLLKIIPGINKHSHQGRTVYNNKGMNGPLVTNLLNFSEITFILYSWYRIINDICIVLCFAKLNLKSHYSLS